jgi:signal transduction histidine kinase
MKFALDQRMPINDNLFYWTVVQWSGRNSVEEWTLSGAEIPAYSGRPSACAVLCHALTCLAFLILATIHAHGAEPRRVLLLHAFGHPYSPWSDEAGAFRAELIKRSPEQIELYEASLDTGRVRDVQAEEPFVSYIHALLSEQKPDLLVPAGAPAADFVQRHRTSLYPEVPMLVMGADVRRVPHSSLSENDTAVLVSLDLPAFLGNILRLRPQTTSVAVVVGNSPVERYWTAELRHDFEPFAGRVGITWLNDLTFNEMLSRAATMPPNSAILWFLLSEDAAGVTYAQDRALEKMREVSSVPIFGIGDYELGRGIVGGPLIQSQSLGQAAAEVALRILKGAKPGDINPSPVVFGAPMYDWRELRRWGIAESRLPPGSIVQFREPTVWEQYRWQIMLAGAIMLAQTLLIAYVLFQNRRRRAAEADAAKQRQEATHLMRVSVMGELSGAIAHEINQPLTAILSNAQAALHLLAQKSPNLADVRDAISDIIHDNNRAGDVIVRLRNLLKKGEHKPEPIDLNELIQSTIALLHSELIARRTEVQTDLASSLPAAWGDSVQLQQVLLNLLMNAMDAMSLTPAAMRRVTIATRAPKPGTLEVSIRDQGPGIGPNGQDKLFEPFYTSKDNGLGLGLAICSTIAQAHDGKLMLANHQGGGAVAVFSLPAQQLLIAAK